MNGVEMRLTRRAFLKLAGSGTLFYGFVLLTGCQHKSAPEPPPIISREEWHAVPPQIAESIEGPYDATTNPGGWYVYAKPLEQVLTTIVVHHTALPLSDGPFEIQKKHMHDKGYADIGYHFVIDPDGKIYAGRDLSARGAHTGGHNTGTIGISLMGNFEETEPLEAQLTSLKRLSGYLRDAYKLTHIAGHRDFQPGVTVCPGVHLESCLPQLAIELHLKFGVEGYIGPPTP
ncbi:MAG: hypothetical protein GVY30_10970 [Chloroflexi bacterium]|nr:hypothetical protein [Chloroflexota bacterium]